MSQQRINQRTHYNNPTFCEVNKCFERLDSDVIEVARRRVAFKDGVVARQVSELLQTTYGSQTAANTHNNTTSTTPSGQSVNTVLLHSQTHREHNKRTHAHARTHAPDSEHVTIAGQQFLHVQRTRNLLQYQARVGRQEVGTRQRTRQRHRLHCRRHRRRQRLEQRRAVVVVRVLVATVVVVSVRVSRVCDASSSSGGE